MMNTGDATKRWQCVATLSGLAPSALHFNILRVCVSTGQQVWEDLEKDLGCYHNNRS